MHRAQQLSGLYCFTRFGEALNFNHLQCLVTWNFVYQMVDARESLSIIERFLGSFITVEV
jgi:hypothetical protein